MRPGASTCSHSVHRSGRTWARIERRSHARSPYPDAGLPVKPSASNSSEGVGSETLRLLRTSPLLVSRGRASSSSRRASANSGSRTRRPVGSAPDVHPPIRESLGEEGLVRRVDARLDGAEDASSFVGRDLRPAVRQELSAAGQVPLAKPANERCPRCAGGGRRPGFLPVLPDPPPGITGQCREHCERAMQHGFRPGRQGRNRLGPCAPRSP